MAEIETRVAEDRAAGEEAGRTWAADRADRVDLWRVARANDPKEVVSLLNGLSLPKAAEFRLGFLDGAAEVWVAVRREVLRDDRIARAAARLARAADRAPARPRTKYEEGAEAARNWVLDYGLAELRRVAEAADVEDAGVLDEVEDAPEEVDPEGAWAAGFMEAVEDALNYAEMGL